MQVPLCICQPFVRAVGRVLRTRLLDYQRWNVEVSKQIIYPWVFGKNSKIVVLDCRLKESHFQSQVHKMQNHIKSQYVYVLIFITIFYVFACVSFYRWLKTGTLKKGHFFECETLTVSYSQASDPIWKEDHDNFTFKFYTTNGLPKHFLCHIAFSVSYSKPAESATKTTVNNTKTRLKHCDITSTRYKNGTKKATETKTAATSRLSRWALLR